MPAILYSFYILLSLRIFLCQSVLLLLFVWLRRTLVRSEILSPNSTTQTKYECVLILSFNVRLLRSHFDNPPLFLPRFRSYGAGRYQFNFIYFVRLFFSLFTFHFSPFTNPFSPAAPHKPVMLLQNWL